MPPEMLFSPIEFNLSSFSIHLSVKFTSVVEKQPLISPQTSAGSRQVRISCRRLGIPSRVKEERWNEGTLETPGEHECLCNLVLNKNLWAFLLHDSLFLDTQRL